jgi:hypothetical protein
LPRRLHVIDLRTDLTSVSPSKSRSQLDVEVRDITFVNEI